MKLNSISRSVREFAFWLLIANFLLVTQTTGFCVDGPQWWYGRGVVDAGQKVDENALVNQGQLKMIALAAFEEMENVFLTAPSDQLISLINSWTQKNAEGRRVPSASNTFGDYEVVNVGQLKFVASLFYDRLLVSPPWLSGLNYQSPTGEWYYGQPYDEFNKVNDYAPINVGQLKNVFSFQLVQDTDLDGNGVADYWEKKYFGRTGVNPNGDDDGDGISNRDEYRMGTSPTQNDNGIYVETFVYDDGSRLLRNLSSGYSYDAEGNILSVVK